MKLTQPYTAHAYECCNYLVAKYFAQHFRCDIIIAEATTLGCVQ